MANVETVEAAPRSGAAVALSLGGALLVSAFLAWLTYLRDGTSGGPEWVGGLSAVAAAANAACATCLAAGFVAVRRRRLVLHRNLMLAAVTFSAVFFASYVIRHFYYGDTPFEGTGLARTLYLSVLATHVLGSMVVLMLLPLALRFAWLRRFDSHRAVNRWLLPIWLYVSVTGVGIYFALH